MTERERREGTGETKDNVRDEHDEASKDRKKDATPSAVEEEEATGGGGGPVKQVQDTVGGVTEGLPVVGGVLGGGGKGGGGPVEQVQDTVGGLTGGVKDNVKDEQDETQRH
jgi:hypothetical protein